MQNKKWNQEAPSAMGVKDMGTSEEIVLKICILQLHPGPLSEIQSERGRMLFT